MQRLQLDDHGSFVVEGPKYSVIQFRGPVQYRQDQANEHKVACYFEAHLNSMGNMPVADAVFAIAAYEFATPWGLDFTRRCAKLLGIRNDGVKVGIKGCGLVSRVRWPRPGLVLEPGFISNPAFAERLVNGGGIALIGQAIAESIIQCWPDGCTVGCSIGHRYRGTGDMGALAAKMENPEFDQEAEIAEAYVDDFTRRLVAA